MNDFHNGFKDLAYFFWIVVIFYFVQVVTEITIIDYKKVQDSLLSLFSMQKDNYTGVSYLLWSCGILGFICYSIYDYYKDKEKEEKEEEEEYYVISVDGNKVEGYGDDTKAYDENYKKLAKNGKRIIKFSDGATYEGNIKGGLWHGKGIHKEMNGYKVVGEWKNHKLSGYANITYPKNDERLYYKGNFKDNLKHGKGEMKWKGGDEYSGNWVDDLFEGYGEYWWADDERLYAGEWKNNNMHGKGQMEENERKWVGEWVDDEKYKGEWIYYDDEISETKEKNKEKGKRENTKRKSEKDLIGTGSGIIISRDGYIATNHHVINNASKVEVEFNYNNEIKSFNVKIIRDDESNDLAILKINDKKFKNLTSIPFSFNKSTCDVGTEVYALGYPVTYALGNEVKFTDGKIGAKSGIGGNISTYQHSAPISPGNSGGPLFDTNGNLVGLNVAGISREFEKSINANISGVFYAVKSSYLIQLIEALPQNIILSKSKILNDKRQTEQIKELSKFVVLIKVY